MGTAFCQFLEEVAAVVLARLPEPWNTKLSFLGKAEVLIPSGVAMLLASRLLWNSMVYRYTYKGDVSDRSNMNYAINRRAEIEKNVAPQAQSTMPLPDFVENNSELKGLIEQIKDSKNNLIEEGYKSTSDGTLLFYRYFHAPKSVSKSTILCFAGGYNGNQEFTQYRMGCIFAAHGFDVFQYDHRGHGRSDGLFGCIKWDTQVNDAEEMFEFAKRKFGNEECNYFMLGSSMGGAVCLDVSMRQDFECLKGNHEIKRWNGMILAAPMVKIDPDRIPPRPVLEVMQYTLVPLIPYWAVVPPGKDLINFVSKDQATLDWLLSFPTIRYTQGVRPITGFSMITTADRMEASMERVSLPMMIIHGSDDEVTHPEYSQYLFDRAQSLDKTVKIYDGGWHMNFDDLHCEKVYSDVIGWLNDRIGHRVFRDNEFQIQTFAQKQEFIQGI